MKRYFAILALLVLLLCGCSKHPDVDSPATFCYPRLTILYGNSGGVIGTETRESSGYENNLTGLLNLYVAGPENSELKNPFPENCRVISAELENGSCTIVLDDVFADLSGMDLSLACTSLGMTAVHLTGCEIVVIRAENRLLDGEETRIYQGSTLQLSDDYVPETQP